MLVVLLEQGCTALFPFEGGGDVVPNPDGGTDGGTDGSTACGNEDADEDGTPCAEDCDDTDPLVHPGAPDGLGPGEWRGPEAVAEGAAGGVDLQIDDRGVAHVAYSTASGVELASQSGPPGAWRPVPVLGQPGRWTRLRLGASGLRHIVTLAPVDEPPALHYLVSPDGSAWTDSFDRPAEDAPLALHVGLTEAIVYQQRDEDQTWLNWITPGGQATALLEVWSVEVVLRAALTTARGETVVAYASDLGGLYLRRDIESPDQQVISPDAVDAVALEADGTGWLLLAYRSSGNLYAAWEPPEVGEPWSSDLVAMAAGVSLDLAFDSQERPWIASVRCDGACTDGSPGLLVLHTFTGDEWHETELDAGPAVSWVALAIDGDDALHLAYGDVDRQEVYYLTNRREADRDTDCDGVIGRDADGDQFASIASGGEDCDDSSAEVHPGAPDDAGSDDRDCDGVR